MRVHRTRIARSACVVALAAMAGACAGGDTAGGVSFEASVDAENLTPERLEEPEPGPAEAAPADPDVHEEDSSAPSNEDSAPATADAGDGGPGDAPGPESDAGTSPDTIAPEPEDGSTPVESDAPTPDADPDLDAEPQPEPDADAGPEPDTDAPPDTDAGAPPLPPGVCETIDDCLDDGPLSSACAAWSCQASACVEVDAAAGTPCSVVPPDADPACFAASCNGGGSCVASPLPGAPCDDGNPCTEEESCSTGGSCQGGVPLICPAPGACQLSVCDALAGGCVDFAAPDGQPCSDGNPCTTSTHCEAGGCAGGDNVCTCTTDADCPDDGDLCNGIAGCVAQSDGALACAIPPTSQVNCPKPEDPCFTSVCQPDSGECSTAILPGAKCIDGDACTKGDTCDDEGICSGKPVLCDDGDACTLDSCNEDDGTCKFFGLNGGPCADGDPCTTADACVAGFCEGTPKACFDGKVCTSDVCDGQTGKCVFTGLDAEPCDDSSACTTGDTCVSDQCVASPIVCSDDDPCTEDGCHPILGCTFNPHVGGCDDGDACTVDDACVDAACVGAEVSCDDGLACTLDLCAALIGCTHTPDAAACGDGSPCTEDSCVVGEGCVHEPADGECNDDDACTTFDTCVGGACVGSGVECNDDVPCTADTCDPASGCQHAANSAACSDGNDCTDDACDKVAGCVHGDANQKPCDDGLPCTVGDTCQDAACVPGSNECECETDADCDDEDPCNGVFACVGDGVTSCEQVGAPVVCEDDGDPCTNIACAPATAACVQSPVEGEVPCPDNDACTVDEHCVDGTCSLGALLCDDDVPCTSDACDAAAGCLHSPDDGACAEDGVGCTDALCLQGEGCTQVPDSEGCDDGVGCTVDLCAVESGCAHEPDPGLCPSGSACAAAACNPGAGCALVPLEGACDDDEACTADSCDLESGCTHEQLEGACNDDNPCTEGDFCAMGACVPGAPLLCDDDNPCTADGCSGSAGGCDHPSLGDGVTCDDGDGCTDPDTCQGGQCASGPASACDDGIACTLDTCDALLGCVHTPDDSICGDGEACTQDACVPGQGCAHLPVADFTGCDDGTLGTNPDVCMAGACVGFQTTAVKVAAPFLCKIEGSGLSRVGDLDGNFFAIARYEVSGQLCVDGERSLVLSLDGVTKPAEVIASKSNTPQAAIAHDAVLVESGAVGKLVFAGGWFDAFANDLQSALYSSVGLGPWQDAWADRIVDAEGDTVEERYYFGGQTQNGAQGRIARCVRTPSGEASSITCMSLDADLDGTTWSSIVPVAAAGRVFRSEGCIDCPETFDGTAFASQDEEEEASLLVAGADDDLVRHELPGEPEVNDVARLAASSIWVVGDDGYVARFDGSSAAIFEGPEGLGFLNIQAAARVRGSLVMVGFTSDDVGPTPSAWLVALPEDANPADPEAWITVELGSAIEAWDLHASDHALHVVGRSPGKNNKSKQGFLWYLSF